MISNRSLFKRIPQPAVSLLQVCLAIRQFYPVMAGAAERCRRYAPGLRERGVELSAVARLPEETLPLEETVPGGVAVTRLPVTSTLQALDQTLLETAAERLASAHSGRAVLLTNLAFSHTLPALKKIRAAGLPLVWLGSMMEDNAAGKSFWNRLRERLHLRSVLASFDACAVGSTAMRDWLAQAGIPKRRIRVIGHGVDHARFRPVHDAEEKRALRARFGLPQDGVVVLMVGTITARKGAHLLLEAWEKNFTGHSRAHLVLAGAFDRPTVVHEDQQQKLAVFQNGVRAQLERLAPGGHARHLGEVADVECLMRACDVLILPSEREGVPNVVLEGMSSGLPCVLTPFTGLPKEELGPLGTTWLLAERNAEALAAALRTLVDNPARRTEMGCQAASHARLHFGLDKTLDDYTALYQELAGA